MKILVSGDFVITDDYENKALIDDSVKRLFSKSDYRILNLEAPVTSKNSDKILKTGPHLRCSAEVIIDALSKLKINLLSLANNHILDYGRQGLSNTLSFCNHNNFDWVGVGDNIKLANTAKRIELGNKKISIINFAENEWANASNTSSGSNPLDIVDNVNLIKKEKQEADYVFLIVHGGNEYYRLPSPKMQKRLRFYADFGADLIICHHTHCFSGFETYKNVPIYYGIGNFLFTKPSRHKDWYNGITVEITLKDNTLFTKPIFTTQDQSSFYLSLAKNRKLESFKKKFYELSCVISDSSKLNKKWNEYVEFKRNAFLKIWSPYTFITNRYIKSLLLRLGIKFRANLPLAVLLNNMRCEAHHELSIAVLERELKQKGSN
ncbi:MAG: CapA family protein [Bacteroidota bacterium]|nr:CapA family protein [Bacteroidota bacterium]